MEIRIAELKDVDALCPLFTEFFTCNAKLQPMYCKAENENGAYPKKVIEKEYSDILVAVDNGIIVGFIHIKQMQTPQVGSVVHHDYAEVMAFMVTLIDFAKQWSKDRKLDYIELISLINAKEANSFYDNKDFVTMSHIRRYTL
jgi:hypothetical protein